MNTRSMICRRRPKMEPLEQRALLAAVLVTDNADLGPGTFRAAIEQANEDSAVDTIRFVRNLGVIETNSPIEFSGAQSIDIRGRGTTVQPSTEADAEATEETDFDLFLSSGGADLSIRDVTFQGSRSSGISVPVPVGASGTVNVQLNRVSLVDNDLYGLHIDDHTNASPASIRLSMTRTDVIGNGSKSGSPDFDGVRVDEGGQGDIVVNIRSATVQDNAADGVELDERGEGDVILRARHSTFNNNGTQPQLTDDLEDGLDIDESGDGGIRVNLVNVQANGNEDEGIDFDEQGRGDLVANLFRVQANGNLDENIKFFEDADAEPPDPNDFDLTDPDEIEAFNDALANVNEDASGDIVTKLIFVEANDSRAGDGIRFEEFGFGDIVANLLFVEADSNDDAGIQISEGSALYDDPDVNLPGQNAGDLIMRLIGSRVTNNGDKGVQVEQLSTGDDFGRLQIRVTAFDANG
ncbi:MAG: hypothetical protein HKN47_03730, partial [Pirellulaceae bacterium]|nr:hypothetical protein [Pirellulaceae bacterium]